jgi:hypothetical protein
MALTNRHSLNVLMGAVLSSIPRPFSGKIITR